MPEAQGVKLALFFFNAVVHEDTGTVNGTNTCMSKGVKSLNTCMVPFQQNYNFLKLTNDARTLHKSDLVRSEIS